MENKFREIREPLIMKDLEKNKDVRWGKILGKGYVPTSYLLVVTEYIPNPLSLKIFITLVYSIRQP